MNTIKIGSRGKDVISLQKCLCLIPDGIFGPLTEEAVKKFQVQSGLKPDGIVGPKTWEKLVPCRREITEIILHCTATPEGKDYTVEQIRLCHTAPKPKGNGWSDIGYHYVVYRDGSVHPGRPVGVIGAHCSGHNSNSIGVCYVGGCAADGRTPKDTRTPQQAVALRELVESLLEKYPRATVHCHNEFANKACPCFAVSEL